MAEGPASGWVVGVLPLGEEVPAAQWMVISVEGRTRGVSVAAEGALMSIPGEDCLPEGLVSVGGVPAVTGTASSLLSLSLVSFAEVALWSCSTTALATGSGWLTRHLGRQWCRADR